jgi:colanic acid/amylovoran biosynthesis glycosyltransferase
MKNKKLNIAFFVQSFPAISEIWIINQITELMKSGHHIDIFAQFKSGDNKIHQKVLDYQLLDKTVYIDSLSKKRWPKLKLFFGKLIKNPRIDNVMLFFHYFIYLLLSKKKNISFYSTIHFIDKPQYDIVHAHYGFNGNYVLLLKDIGLFRKSKLITSFHGFDFNVKPGFYKSLFEKGDMFSVNSAYSRNMLINLGCPNKSIYQLPVGLEISFFEREKHSKSSSKNCFTIIFIGRFVECKSPLTFVEICKELVDSKIEFKAKMIGDGELFNSVQSAIKEYNLKDVVELMGKQTQEELLIQLYDADLFVLTGIKDSTGIAETQGLVIQEAQSMELPVIVSDAGGMKEGMIDNETGFVIKDNMVDSYVEKIIHLKNNESTRIEMGKKGRAFVSQNYNISMLNEKLIQLYYHSTSNRKIE